MNRRFAAGIFFAAFLFLSAFVYADEPHPWLPVNSSDLQMKEFKPLPDAKAVLLYYDHEIDDNNHTSFYYSRIKILTDDGKKYADLEIPIVGKISVQQLAARTIHPDGKIVEFTGQPFEKTVLRGKGIKIRVQSILLPEVSVGDVVEYKYVLHFGDEGFGSHTWKVQHDLYAVKEHFGFRYDKHLSVSWLPFGDLSPNLDQDQKAGTLKLDLGDVSPFEPEEQMPPEEEFRQQIKFFYKNPFLFTPELYWSETGLVWARSINEYLGQRHKEIDRVAEEAIGNETDPVKKLRKLYARAQEIRNLSYERDREKVEEKREGLKDNTKVVDVLKRGYGDRDDITMFFVSMARSAGFTSSVVFVASRDSNLFNKNILSFEQLNFEIAAIHLNGKTIYLDPGTRYCPYGLLPWKLSGTASMDMSSPGRMEGTPDTKGEDAFTSRSADMNLSPDGSVKGEVRLEFSGLEALDWRLAALETDEAGRKKALEETLKAWLPDNAVVNMTNASGWDNENEPLTAIFNVEVPSFASAAGKRLMIPTAFFTSQNKWALKSGTRKYPVYFHYAHMEADRLSVQMPEGYSVESLAAPQAENAKFARYASKTSITGQRVHLLRSLNFGGTYFKPEYYDELRSFLMKVQVDDESQTVVRPTPKAEAQKSN